MFESLEQMQREARIIRSGWTVAKHLGRFHSLAVEIPDFIK